MATKTDFSPSVDVAAAARVHSQASGSRIDAEMLKVIGLIGGTGLILSLLLATEGLDLSVGFF
jgi:hypothetical protein